MWVYTGGAWHAVTKQWIWSGGAWRLGYDGTAPVLTTIVVSPNPASVAAGQTVDFSAEGFDQFGADMGAVSPSWAVSGTSSIDSSGHCTTDSGVTGVETDTVTATIGSVVGTASLTVSGP
jgi:hypothetical protein